MREHERGERLKEIERELISPKFKVKAERTWAEPFLALTGARQASRQASRQALRGH